MDNKKVIIVDETKEENEILTEEELEEQARQQRLRLLKKPKRNVPSVAIIIAGLFGIMLAMLLQSGVILSVSLIVVFVSAVLHYILFK